VSTTTRVAFVLFFCAFAAVGAQPLRIPGEFDDQGTFIWVGAAACPRPTEAAEGGYCPVTSARFRLPASVSVDSEGEQAEYTAEDGAVSTIGVVERFLWMKWVELIEGASIDATIEGAALELDLDALGEGLRRAQFLQLHPRR
jgi:hypothetical protein